MAGFDWNLILDFASRLFLAAFLGVLISFRRYPNRYHLNLIEAHAFLSTAGAMFMVIIEGEIIRAVGLLGAASVIRYRYAIRNPRDAGTLIVSLGLGMACGSGLLEVAIVGAIFILVVSRLLSHFPEMLPFSYVRRKEEAVLRLQTEAYEETMQRVTDLFHNLGVVFTVTSFERKVSERLGLTTEVDLQFQYDASLDLRQLTERLLEDDKLHRLSWRDVPEESWY